MTAPSGRRVTLREISEALLAAVVDHFTAAGVALPERRYIAPGDPGQVAWDCEQLFVAIQGVGWGQAPSESTEAANVNIGSPVRALAIRHAVLVVSLVRCTPSEGDLDTGMPDVADIHAAGLAFMDDMGLLSQALLEACTRIRPGLPKPALVEPGAVTPEGPSGAYHGMTAPLAITVGDLA